MASQAAALLALIVKVASVTCPRATLSKKWDQMSTGTGYAAVTNVNHNTI